MVHDIVLGHLPRLSDLLSLLRLSNRGVSESADDVLEAALRVVRSEAGSALALLNRVRALAELLQPALVHL